MKKPRMILIFSLLPAVLTFGLLIFRAWYDVKTYRLGSRIDEQRNNGFDYVLCLPKGYCDFSGKRPLLIYLHGAGGVGKDISAIDESGMFYDRDSEVTPDDFPFIVLRPVTPTHGWKPDSVVRFLDTFLADKRFRYKIDESRIYLTGYSMGGFGTFAAAAKFPDRFAAIAPLAGGFDPADAQRLLRVPIWAFHGDADETVPFESSEKIVQALKEQNHPDVRLTELTGFGHDIWGEVYNRQELYRWFLEHKRNPLSDKMNDNINDKTTKGEK